MDIRRSSPLIVHQTVSGATAVSLRERILRGDFEEGQSLLQDVLASEYGVSRIPLREALRQLETEGLVTSIPHRGYMVAVLSLDEVIELCEVRALLECDILTHAIPNMTATHFDRAQKVLDKCERLMENGADDFDCDALNWEFHSILYEASNRKRSLRLISSLHNSPDRMARMKASAAIGWEDIHRRQCHLLELCQQGDVEKCVEYLKANIAELTATLEKMQESQQ